MPDTVQFSLNSKCLEVHNDGVTIEDKEGNRTKHHGDTILYALGMKSKKTELETLMKEFPNSRSIGDCKKPARVLQALRDGMFAALDI